MRDPVLSLIFLFMTIFGIWSFSINYKDLKNRENLLGKIHYRWNSKFKLTLPFNWVIWTIFIVYIILSALSIFIEQRDSKYFSIFFLLIVLSFYPDWQVVVGSKGITIGRKVVLWEMVKEWRIYKEGNFVWMEINWVYENSPTKINKKRIPIPPEAREIIENTMREKTDANPKEVRN